MIPNHYLSCVSSPVIQDLVPNAELLNSLNPQYSDTVFETTFRALRLIEMERIEFGRNLHVISYNGSTTELAYSN